MVKCHIITIPQLGPYAQNAKPTPLYGIMLDWKPTAQNAD